VLAITVVVIEVSTLQAADQTSGPADGIADLSPSVACSVFTIYESDLLVIDGGISGPAIVTYSQLDKSRVSYCGDHPQTRADTLSRGFLGEHLRAEENGPPRIWNRPSGNIRRTGSPGICAERAYDESERPVSGWRAYVPGKAEGIDFAVTMSGGEKGSYSISNLTTGMKWIIRTDPRHDIPSGTESLHSCLTRKEVDARDHDTAVSQLQQGSGSPARSEAPTIEDPDRTNRGRGTRRREMSITWPADITLACREAADPSLTGEPAVTGGYGPCDVSYTDEIIPGSDPLVDTIERTWIVADANGDGGTCIQTIIAEDNIPPYFLTDCPSDMEVECGMVPLAPQMVAEDNCDVQAIVYYEEEIIDVDNPYDYTLIRSWTAIDDCGNETTLVQDIKVRDSTPPVIMCPCDITCESDSLIEFGEATAIDNCDPDPEITYEDNMIPGSSPQAYTIVRTWIATDASDNSDSCVQYVKIANIIEETTEPLSVLVPEGFELTPQPNPFYGSTTIGLVLHVDGNVIVEIYDIHGRNVVTLQGGYRNPGYHCIDWNGNDTFGTPVVSGVYFCRARISGRSTPMGRLVKLE
jgi:hypothetical protein